MPKVRYSKELILEKAIILAERDGHDKINVRELAKEVGCSVAPIYTAFGSFETVLEEVNTYYLNKLQDYISEKYSDNTFLNIGVGIVRFTMEYPNTYLTLLLKSSNVNQRDKIHGAMVNIMYQNPLHQYFDKKELETLLEKMDTFTQGLCTQIAIEKNTELSLEQCRDILNEVGTEMILGMLATSGKVTLVDTESNQKINCFFS